MKLTINRRQFSDHLQTAFGVASKAGKDVLANVKLISVPDGYDLHAQSQELGLIVRGEPVSRQPGSCLLSPKVLSILKECSDEELTIEATDREVIVQTESARFTLGSQNPDKFPSVKELTEGVQFDLPCEAVRRIASQVGYAIDEESTRYQLAGVNLSVGNSILNAVATDGRRMATLSLAVMGDSVASGIIPAKALRTVAGAIGDGTATITLGTSHAQFRSDTATLVTRLVEGRYPNWQSIIPEDCDPIAIPAGPWSSVVRQASIVADPESRGIDLVIGQGSLSMAAKTADIGSSSVTMPVGTDRECKATIDYRFLSDFLRSVDPSLTVELHLSDWKRPVKLSCGNLVCVIMPMERR